MDFMDNDFAGVCGVCKKPVENHQPLKFVPGGVVHQSCVKEEIDEHNPIPVH